MGDDFRDRMGKTVRFREGLFGGESVENNSGSVKAAFTAEESGQKTSVVYFVERAHHSIVFEKAPSH